MKNCCAARLLNHLCTLFSSFAFSIDTFISDRDVYAGLMKEHSFKSSMFGSDDVTSKKHTIEVAEMKFCEFVNAMQQR